MKELSSVLLAFSVSEMIAIICVVGHCVVLEKLGMSFLASLSLLVDSLQTTYNQPLGEELQQGILKGSLFPTSIT